MHDLYASTRFMAAYVMHLHLLHLICLSLLALNGPLFKWQPFIGLEHSLEVLPVMLLMFNAHMQDFKQLQFNL